MAALVAELSPREQLRLVELVVHDLAASPAEGESARRPHWMSIRGIVVPAVFECGRHSRPYGPRL